MDTDDESSCVTGEYLFVGAQEYQASLVFPA